MVGLPFETRDVDPVCGARVDRTRAVAEGLSATVDGDDFVFCGVGCQVWFRQDPRRLLGLDDTPSLSPAGERSPG